MSESMTAPLVVFDGIWKKFRRGELHDSLRDLVPAMMGSLLRRRQPRGRMAANEFWALQDVSFEVGPGDALGIIGPNGAGKSTVLKILTKIVQPTRGGYRVQGRIGALIELAAGFHPDLTGRENVHLQGAVMGMSPGQINRRFDEIVAFSGIEEFIDTPIKRYSSGMNARLGFAIAAHLDPEVLIIDEVLAVGDISFQLKAFDRIKTLVGTGIPVVIVSHQMNRISELCSSALVLDHGRAVRSGSPAECVAEYLSSERQAAPVLEEPSPVALDRITAFNGDVVCSGERLDLLIEGQLLEEIQAEHIEPVGVVVRSAQTGEIVAVVGTSTCGIDVALGPFRIEVSLQMNVQPGIYLVETVVGDLRAEQAVMWGPSVNVNVRAGPNFVGSVQLNASMNLLSPQPAGDSQPDSETS